MFQPLAPQINKGLAAICPISNARVRLAIGKGGSPGPQSRGAQRVLLCETTCPLAVPGSIAMHTSAVPRLLRPLRQFGQPKLSEPLQFFEDWLHFCQQPTTFSGIGAFFQASFERFKLSGKGCKAFVMGHGRVIITAAAPRSYTVLSPD